ncbi:hypothetical protein PIB30_009202 [Stylosanthes scabra]|uniref:Aminotransferase-like plant mobile domain-containing protein n=1 Tax=Stylosanthes scabra TaxID=79078 RepID=A0ABU6Z2Y4_9FABA|nr:hypothetical protein [Stylosanthes scabra]
MFGELPNRASEELVIRHARAYIMMLLSTAFFEDKTVARVHLRWLPFVVRIDDLDIRLGIRSSCLAIQESYRFDTFEWSLASRWERYLLTSDEKEMRVIHHRRQLDLMTLREFVILPYRVDAVEAVVHPSVLQADHRALWTSIVPLIYFETIEWHQVDRVIPQFGGVQNALHQPLNIDFMYANHGRRSDRLWPQKYQCWHSLWASRFTQLFDVAQAEDPGPSADFLR